LRGVKALVYVDEMKVVRGCVKRMNQGIKDAVSKGMPLSYVEKVVRPFVREELVKEEEEPFHPDKIDVREGFISF
jgi:hypothetical protein